jgi:hypothetical protein
MEEKAGNRFSLRKMGKQNNIDLTTGDTGDPGQQEEHTTSFVEIQNKKTTQDCKTKVSSKSSETQESCFSCLARICTEKTFLIPVYYKFIRTNCLIPFYYKSMPFIIFKNI